MKSFRYIALAALTLSFAACTQEDDFTPQGDSDAVKINATIGAMQTRVAYDANGATTFTKGDAFKVVNTMRSTKNEATYTTTDGTDWTTTDAFVWNGGTATNQFQAWYPATASYDSFTLPINQSVGIEVADWMTATTIEIWKPDDGVLNLNFYHRLAKVTVEIADWNSEFDNQTHEITYPIIYSKGTYLTADYDDFDGSVTITSTGNDIGITPLVNGDKESYTAIVAPVKYNTSDTFMTFTVNGQEMTVKANGNTTLTEGLQAGKHYTFNLSVGKEAVSIASVDVEQWTGKAIDGGVAEEDFSSINATNMSANNLNAAVTMALETGVTDLTITLAANASAEMFTAIRRALIDTDAQGINLTLAGVTEIPEHNLTNPETAIFGEVYGEDYMEKVTQLASINLPDVVTIGSRTFFSCENLASVTAPKVQIIGEKAFAWTALTSVELPEATTIGLLAFDGCYSLATVKLPSATSIDKYAFGNCNSMTTYLELTAEGEVELGNDVFDDPSFPIDVDLMLHANKKSQVTFNDDDTAIWNGYTFKSIEFVGE